MDVGSLLRGARERRGITLEQIAYATKITRPILAAIERNDFQKVPGGLFARAFLRAYATQVGLRPDAVVDAYLAQIAPTPEPEPPTVERERAAAWAMASAAARHAHVQLASWGNRHADKVSSAIVALRRIGFDSRQWDRIDRRALKPALVAITVLAVLSAATYRTMRAVPPSSTERSGSASRIDVDGSPSSLEPPAIAATSGRIEDLGPLRKEGRLRIELRARGPCWISASADGARVVYRLMELGEHETLTTRDLMLRVGDPSQLQWTIDGMPGRALGPAGTPVTVEITEQNYRDFLVR